MISILVSVIGGLAVFSWIIALIAAVQIVRLAPKGEGLKVYGRLGWWNFEGVRALTGPAADPHIRVYQRAFIGFIACVIIAILGGTLLAAVATT